MGCLGPNLRAVWGHTLRWFNDLSQAICQGSTASHSRGKGKGQSSTASHSWGQGQDQSSTASHSRGQGQSQVSATWHPGCRGGVSIPGKRKAISNLKKFLGFSVQIVSARHVGARRLPDLCETCWTSVWIGLRFLFSGEGAGRQDCSQHPRQARYQSQHLPRPIKEVA